MTMNRREFIRFNSLHLVYYSLFDRTMKNCGEGVGRTLNLSEGGALIELNAKPLGTFTTVVLELALRDSLIKFQGRVIYTNQLDQDKLEVGIQFMDMTDEQKQDLQEFFTRFTSTREKESNLIRENVSNIDNVVLTLSKEHKIIKDYVIGCRDILEKNQGTSQTRDLEVLFYFMEKDMLRHFRFEEDIIFQAALSGEQNDAMTRLVRLLINDHNQMTEQIRNLRARLDGALMKDGCMDEDTLRDINVFLDTVRNHAREEMVHLFPAIDEDKSKIRVLNRLLTGVTR